MLSPLSKLRPLLGTLLLLPVLSWADDNGASLMSQAVRGPSDIAFKDQAVLKLPAGFVFLPKEPAAQVMEKLGNRTDARFLGLIFPQDQNADWMVDVEYEDAGYVKDDDAKHWDADGLLKSLKDGTEASNEDRKSHNVPELEVTGWAQVPSYDPASHQLVWSALAREKGAPADRPQTINYNTYTLGREGYLSLNLITDAAHIEADKPVAKTLLSDLHFNSGKRYEDFNASTDHVAEYGLAALVAGVAAKKLGLLAMAGVFFAKFFKVIAVGLVAASAGIRKFFSRKTEG